MSEVNYLCLIVSEEGIRTDPDKIEALKSLPVLKKMKELRSFLGFTGHYRRFIKDYARIVPPLTKLLARQSTAKKKKRTRETERRYPGYGIRSNKVHLSY